MDRHFLICLSKCISYAAKVLQQYPFIEFKCNDRKTDSNEAAALLFNIPPDTDTPSEGTHLMRTAILEMC
jgi:hypothetical protein